MHEFSDDHCTNTVVSQAQVLGTAVVLSFALGVVRVIRWYSRSSDYTCDTSGVEKYHRIWDW